jgi:hypothetical protein
MRIAERLRNVKSEASIPHFAFPNLTYAARVLTAEVGLRMPATLFAI